MPRSGTTLVDKLLSIHPKALVFSQPLPLLYVRVKTAFVSTLGDRPGAEDHYPLNDMFRGNWFRPEDLLEFLGSFRLENDFCREVLEEMIPFEGQYTKFEDPLRVLNGYRPTSLYRFVERYLETFAIGRELCLLGSKETYCEEYIPYFLTRGARVLEIVRDPRDVITSLDKGSGGRFGGRRKPHLFNLRQWRKSVAFALAHQRRADFLALRYEDLVRDPPSVAARITDFLELPLLAPEVFESDLRSQSGEIWRSNSSHRAATRITADSIGRYRRHLSRETDLFIQAVCFHEMKLLGYDVEIGEDEVLPILDRHRELEPLARPELGFWTWSEQRREEESTRWRMLREGTFEPSWFAFEAAFSQLARWREGASAQ